VVRDALPSYSLQWLALLALCLLCCGLVTGADQPFPHDTKYVCDAWTSDHGLPQNSIAAIVQTGDGYVYAGTQEGLVRFNGSQFTLFDAESSPAFSRSSFVLTMLLDSDGAVWIGTESGVVLLRNGRLEQVLSDSPLAGLAVKTISEAHAGVIWIGTREGDLLRLEDGQLRSIQLPEEVSTTSILCSCLDQQGRLWIGTNGAGLIRLEEQRLKLLRVADGLASDQVSALLCDRSGRLLIGTADGSLMAHDGAGTYAIALPGISSRINSIFEDSHGRIWLATHGQGIGRLDENGLTIIDRSAGISNDVVLSIIEDHEGNLWVGTDGGGLNRLTESIFNVFDTSRGLSHDVVFPMVETSNGAMWVGTEGGGLNRIGTDGSVMVVTTADGLADDKIFSLFEADDGVLWIGTYGGGLNRMYNGQIETLTTDDGLASDFIWSLLGDSSGRLWIGTDGSGLDLYENGLFTNFSIRNGLSDNQIPVIYEASDGAIWVGTAAGGLNRWDGSGWTVLDSRHGLSSDKVLTIHEDRQGALWIGTSGGGISRYKDGRFSAIRKQDGLSDNLIYQILEDDLGYLWMSCNRGLFRAHKSELDDFADGVRDTVVCQTYGKAEGMKSTECNGSTQPAGYRHSNGSLWFPTLKGAVVVDPGRIRERSTPPPIVIEELLADGRKVAPGHKVVLPPGTRNIEIRYTGLSYTAPEKLQFRYRLQGYEESWADVGNRRTAYYTNLAPGDYRFQMTAGNNDGVWNRSPASISFSLEPYLYQRRWFQLAVVVGIVLTTLLLHIVRVRHLRRREEELSARVDAAMAEIKVLSGLLPICASCKKIRDDKQRWQPIESYISDHSLAEFSHGLCPECAQRYYTEVVEQQKQT
jgi:ligand-binding sensor domain-containing protein